MTEAEERDAESEAESGTGEDDGSEMDLVAEVATYDEALAGDVGALEQRVEELESALEETEAELRDTEARLEETTERLEHTRADFQNYKKRAKRQQAELKERATEDLVERLLEVRDNLSRALEEESGDADSLREGVELTRKQFDRVLDAENVEPIEPEPGADVDATRHEVMMRVESDQPADTIASVYRPGYEMAGSVLRPAQVTVAEAAEDEGAETDDAPAGDDAAESDGSDTAQGVDGAEESASETDQSVGEE